MHILNLKILEDGSSTGLSVRNGAFLAEAASVCLYKNDHSLEVDFVVDGFFKKTYKLGRLDVDELSICSFVDLEEAVEYGAMGLAVAVINDQTGWKAKRAYKGLGFDYWFGYQSEYPFEQKLRVEVSGDLSGTDYEIAERLKVKLKQTQKSDHLNIPACAIIIEFGNPKSLTGYR